MDNVKRLVKPRGHFINDRRTELLFGFLMFAFGALLLFDAFNGRGKDLPWPANKLVPW